MALQPLNASSFQQQLIDKGITEDNARLITALTNNLSDAIEIDKDEWFANARKLVVQLIEVLQSRPEDILLFINNQWMPHFKEREQIHRGLDILLLWFKDMIYHDVGNHSLIIFVNEKEKMESSSMTWSRQHVTDILRSIMDAKRKIEQNVNPTLVMEQLTLQIQR
jgi:DNA polymerase-3 subunit delta'